MQITDHKNTTTYIPYVGEPPHGDMDGTHMDTGVLGSSPGCYLCHLLAGGPWIVDVTF